MRQRLEATVSPVPRQGLPRVVGDFQGSSQIRDLQGGGGTPQLPRLEVPGSELFERAPLAPPDLRQAPQVRLISFEARKAPSAPEIRMVSGCFEAPLGGWIPEAEPVAFERLSAMAGFVADGAAGHLPRWHAVPSKTGPEEVKMRYLEPDPGETLRGALLLGFTGSDERGMSAIACFVVCDDRPDAPGCDPRIARLAGPLIAPPPPTALQRALIAAVHAPGTVAAGGLALAILAAAVYLRRRRRPRA